MPITVYRDSKGEIHEIPDDVPFKMGADWEQIETRTTPEEAKFDDAVSKIAQTIGVSTDIAITMLAKALGIEKCPWCQLRGQILRRMGELGWLETLKRLKNTFKNQLAARNSNAD